MEVYRNPASAPPEFQRAFSGGCSIVVIWTEYGLGFGKFR